MAASVSVRLWSRIWESSPKLSKILATTKHYKKTFLMKQLLSSTNSRFRTQTFKSSPTSYCVCVKRLTLCNCLCSSYSRFSASVIQNIREFRANNYFTDHLTTNTIQLFVPTKRKFLVSIIFQNKSQRRVIPYRLLNKYSHLFICILLKDTLSSGQKPVYTVKTITSEQIVFAAKLYFGQVFVFCRLINKSVLEWFLLIMCN